MWVRFEVWELFRFSICVTTLNARETAEKNQFRFEKLVIVVIWLIDRQSFWFVGQNVQQLRLWVWNKFHVIMCLIINRLMHIFVSKQAIPYQTKLMCDKNRRWRIFASDSKWYYTRRGNLMDSVVHFMILVCFFCVYGIYVCVCVHMQWTFRA